MTFLVFLPVMFLFSPLLTVIVVVCCALMLFWLILMLPANRRTSSAVIEAETSGAPFLYRKSLGMRTVKSLALETRQRQEWDDHIAKVSEAD